MASGLAVGGSAVVVAPILTVHSLSVMARLWTDYLDAGGSPLLGLQVRGWQGTSERYRCVEYRGKWGGAGVRGKQAECSGGQALKVLGEDV